MTPILRLLFQLEASKSNKTVFILVNVYCHSKMANLVQSFVFGYSCHLTLKERKWLSEFSFLLSLFVLSIVLTVSN
ncbi:hypothetical protein BLOT_006352 [Blomia tropicalis]|nr:hypothetical protein BLOT_006352 [Blomia tropicalis]